MSKIAKTLHERLLSETEAVEGIVSFFREGGQFDRVVYTEWTAKDVLAHVASWHASFAKNLMDVLENRKPSPFKGSLSQVNESEVFRLAPLSIAELIGILEEAQGRIAENIEREGIESIPYKQGSRNYAPHEHLEIVERHISSHLRDLRKVYGSAG